MNPKIPDGWWEKAFTYKPNPSEQKGHRCGDHQMLTIVAYDISDHKRLAKVAKLCEDYGVRVQYSVFECRLDGQRFEKFWFELEVLIDPATDRILAYKVCANCARNIHAAGIQFNTEKVIAYVF